MQKGNLAEEVLKEIPDQVCLFMEQNQIDPAHLSARYSQVDQASFSTLPQQQL